MVGRGALVLKEGCEFAEELCTEKMSYIVLRVTAVTT